MEVVGLILLGALMLASSIGVIAMRNAIYSALFLIINLVTLAVFFLVLSAQFLFVAQILVYAGAIMVLFLFTVTILNPPSDVLFGGTHRTQYVLALLFGALFGGILTYTVATNAINGTRGNYSAQVAAVGDIQAFGTQLFTVYLLPLETTALILLVGIVGAVVLGRHVAEAPAPRRTYKLQFFTDTTAPPGDLPAKQEAMPTPPPNGAEQSESQKERVGT